MAQRIRSLREDRDAGATTPAVWRARALHITLPLGSRLRLHRVLAARDQARKQTLAAGTRR